MWRAPEFFCLLCSDGWWQICIPDFIVSSQLILQDHSQTRQITKTSPVSSLTVLFPPFQKAIPEKLCFFLFFSFFSFSFSVPSSVPTSEAQFLHRSSWHPPPLATPRAHSTSRPHPMRPTRGDVRSLGGCHPKETLHCCWVTSVVFSSACSDWTYAGHHLLCPLLTTMLARLRSQTEWASPQRADCHYVPPPILLCGLSDVEGFDQNCLRQGRMEETKNEATTRSWHKGLQKLRLFIYAVIDEDEKLRIIIPELTRPRKLQHLQCWSLEQHPQRCIREVDEARLCGSSLPTGPTALPALGRSRPGLKKSHDWWDSNPRPFDPQSNMLTTQYGGQLEALFLPTHLNEGQMAKIKKHDCLVASFLRRKRVCFAHILNAGDETFWEGDDGLHTMTQLQVTQLLQHSTHLHINSTAPGNREDKITHTHTHTHTHTKPT